MEEKTYIFEGKTTNEAIEKGLRELKTSRNKVEIKVLEEEDKKTFFSILAPKVVKVEMKLKQGGKRRESKVGAADVKAAKKELEAFMKEFVSKLPTKDLPYEIIQENDALKVNLKDEKAAYLIGHRGETLNSLKNILFNVANKNSQEKVRVTVDISGYRAKREKDLVNLADKVSESVIKTRKSIALEPMNSNDRRIIHTTLQQSNKVKTHSIGREPYRKVVISLK